VAGKFIGRPSIIAAQEHEVPASDEAPGTLAQFEGTFITVHTLIAMLRYELRESNPKIAERLAEILKLTRPYVVWLES
jgi:hypothetical protein